MNVLIIHGWMHSAKIYEKLASDLKSKLNINCILYEFAGFGDTPALFYSDIINNYVLQLQNYINNNKIDLIIAHSLGGNIVLKLINEIECNNIILLSPEYYGISLLKPAKYIKKAIISILKLLEKRTPITDFILKAFSLFTINKWNLISNQVLDDARRCNKEVATELMIEMADDKWTISDMKLKNIVLVLGEKDRVISKKKMDKLIRDAKLSNKIIISNIGHTAVLEDYDKLFNIIENEVKNVKEI